MLLTIHSVEELYRRLIEVLAGKSILVSVEDLPAKERKLKEVNGSRGIVYTASSNGDEVAFFLCLGNYIQKIPSTIQKPAQFDFEENGVIKVKYYTPSGLEINCIFQAI